MYQLLVNTKNKKREGLSHFRITLITLNLRKNRKRTRRNTSSSRPHRRSLTERTSFNLGRNLISKILKNYQCRILMPDYPRIKERFYRRMICIKSVSKNFNKKHKKERKNLTKIIFSRSTEIK